MHAQYTKISETFTDLIKVVEILYEQILTTSKQGCDIPPSLKISTIKALLKKLDSKLVALHPSLHQTSLEANQLQQTIRLGKVVFQDGQNRVEKYSSVVDCNLSLWTHVQNPPKVSIIEDRVCEVEVMVTQ
jgi:hypothetical protein